MKSQSPTVAQTDVEAGQADELNDQQLLRYSRHILLPEIGIEGQERLRAAHALIVGAGGLGCPAALYLAAAGIGRLTLADSDKVDLTNLQRQILYRTDSVGAVKVDAARSALNAVNPDVAIVAAAQEAGRLHGWSRSADVVLDCTDNFATRHAINRACVQASQAAGLRRRDPLRRAAHGVRPARTRRRACYACLFPEDAQVEEVQCSTMGVFAPLTGVIGAMQAMEAIKLTRRHWRVARRTAA